MLASASRASMILLVLLIIQPLGWYLTMSLARPDCCVDWAVLYFSRLTMVRSSTLDIFILSLVWYILTISSSISTPGRLYSRTRRERQYFGTGHLLSASQSRRGIY